jgi:hypothetical protein
MLAWIAAFVGLGVLSFAAIGRSLESGTWEGFFSSGRTGRTFRPCDGSGTWWVKNPDFENTADELETQYQAMTSKPYEQIYVKLRGDISREGNYGPLGSYSRVIYVEEILEAREKREGDCAEPEA